MEAVVFLTIACVLILAWLVLGGEGDE